MLLADWSVKVQAESVVKHNFDVFRNRLPFVCQPFRFRPF